MGASVRVCRCWRTPSSDDAHLLFSKFIIRPSTVLGVASAGRVAVVHVTGGRSVAPESARKGRQDAPCRRHTENPAGRRPSPEREEGASDQKDSRDPSEVDEGRVPAFERLAYVVQYERPDEQNDQRANPIQNRHPTLPSSSLQR